MAKDDEYRAYMNYTIAFYKLAGLKAMTEGEYYNLYQPERFTTKIIDNWNLRSKLSDKNPTLFDIGLKNNNQGQDCCKLEEH